MSNGSKCLGKGTNKPSRQIETVGGGFCRRSRFSNDNDDYDYDDMAGYLSDFGRNSV